MGGREVGREGGRDKEKEVRQVSLSSFFFPSHPSYLLLARVMSYRMEARFGKLFPAGAWQCTRAKEARFGKLFPSRYSYCVMKDTELEKL